MHRSARRLPCPLGYSTALALGAVLATTALPARAGIVDPGDVRYTAIGDSGAELALQGTGGIIGGIETDLGIDFLRVSDHLDQYWYNRGDSVNGGATATGWARQAGFDSEFGYLPGTSGGDFVSLMKLDVGFGASAPVPIALAFDAPFRPAIRTPDGDVYSALESDNPSAADHMVTWVAADDPLHYVVAFEDLAFPGADGDYNDIVVELKWVLDAPAPQVPEPGLLALLGAGLLGLGAGRRRRRR